MNATQLIASIIFYILSLVLALVLMIISNRIDYRWKKRLIIFHFIILLAYLAALYFLKTESGKVFIFFFCSGICIAGLVIRSHSLLYLKILYSIFPLSVFVFLYSPSLLLSLLLQQKLPDKKNTEFLLHGNYYLARQQSMINMEHTDVKYKIISKTGHFHKTLERDLVFPAAIDSLNVIYFSPDSVLIRGYYSNTKLSDSAEISSDLRINNADEISIKHK